jgi:hypothetical protein
MRLPEKKEAKLESVIGCMKGTIEIKGDIMEPLPSEDWWDEERNI